MFSKIGNFNNITNSPPYPLNRQVAYKNDNVSHSVKRLSLFGYNNGSFQIVLKARNAEKYQIIEQVFLQNPVFGKIEFHNRNQNILRLSTTNLELISHFINAMSNAAPELNEIKQELAESLGIDLSQQYVVPTWLREGNFNQIFNSGAPLNRRVEYRNNNLSSIIEELSFLGYTGGSFQIVLKARTAAKYQTIEQAFLQNPSFGEIDFSDRNVKTIRLRTENLHLMAHFINTMGGAAPELNEIKQELAQSVGFDLSQEYIVSTWLREGNFNQTFDSGAPLNRSVEYRNTNLSSVIKKLSFLGYITGGFQIILRARNTEQYEIIRQAFLQNPSFGAIDFFDRDHKTLRLSTGNLGLMSHFINVMSNAAPELNEIKQELAQSVGMDLSQPYISPIQPAITPFFNAQQPVPLTQQEGVIEAHILQQTLNTSFTHSQPSQTNQSSAPGAGRNEARLVVIEYPFETIPSEYKCSLTDFVMDEPVYVTTMQEIKYDKRQILHWLTIDPINPYSRERMNDQDLIEDTVLKDNINQFISNAEQAHLEKNEEAAKKSRKRHRDDESDDENSKKRCKTEEPSRKRPRDDEGSDDEGQHRKRIRIG